jgi:hypothetical protein
MRRGVLALAPLVVISCHRAPPATSPARADVAWARPAQAGEVAVADVNGVPIWSGDVAKHARATHLDAREAVADLIDQEILAQEARRRGLADDSDVREARNQALVRRFVSEDFGPRTATPDTIPPEAARPAYDARHDYFFHDRLLKVWNVCTNATTAQSIATECKRHPPKDKDEFQAIATRFGSPAQNVLIEETSRGVQLAWRDAMMSLLHKAGEVSPPVNLPQLPYDCKVHIAYVEMARPKEAISFQDALPEIRTRIFDDWRRLRFSQWTSELRGAHKVIEEPGPLSQLQAD